jgi:hypothetical protein
METRQLIREKLKPILEAKIDPHFLERLKLRILEADTVSVGYELENTVGQYKIVGTYQIPQDIKQRALDTYNTIVKTNFPKSQSLGIKVADIMINPKMVNYMSHIDMNELRGKTLILVDEATNSNGNIVYAIIRQNEAITIFFAKSYVNQTPEKMKVDVIIKNMANYRPR